MDEAMRADSQNTHLLDDRLEQPIEDRINAAVERGTRRADARLEALGITYDSVNYANTIDGILTTEQQTELIKESQIVTGRILATGVTDVPFETTLTNIEDYAATPWEVDTEGRHYARNSLEYQLQEYGQRLFHDDKFDRLAGALEGEKNMREVREAYAATLQVEQPAAARTQALRAATRSQAVSSPGFPHLMSLRVSSSQVGQKHDTLER